MHYAATFNVIILKFWILHLMKALIDKFTATFQTWKSGYATARRADPVNQSVTTAAVGGGAPTRRTSASRLGQARHRFQWRCACPPNAGTATSRLLRFFHLHLRRPPLPRSRSQIRLPAANRQCPVFGSWHLCKSLWYLVSEELNRRDFLKLKC